MRLKTVRRKLLHEAGYITTHARRTRLLLSAGYALRGLYQQILTRIRDVGQGDPPSVAA